MVREAKNRGSFYPDRCEELNSMIEEFNSFIDTKYSTLHSIKPKAIISPHAGFIYSGFTANLAHKILANSQAKRVVIIGPSHHRYFEGVSGYFGDYFETPCGNLLIDKEFLKLLKDNFNILSIPDIHYLEHSTETQMPFIAKYQKAVKVIKLIYGKVDYKVISQILEFSFKDRDTIVVISSDLSHFYPLEYAKKIDNICLAGVVEKNNQILDRGCEACGILGIKALIEVSKKFNFSVKLLDYRTSADITGDRERVVGYMSALFY